MVRVETEVLSPAGSDGKPKAHTVDTDCRPHLNGHGECTVCGVVAGDPCRYCSRESFHADHCPEADTITLGGLDLRSAQLPWSCNDCGSLNIQRRPSVWFDWRGSQVDDDGTGAESYCEDCREIVDVARISPAEFLAISVQLSAAVTFFPAAIDVDHRPVVAR
jgi:hypothetical protein